MFLTSDPRQEDITSALDRVLDTWARPLAKDAALVAQTGASKTTRSRIDLGDLPAGRSMWVSGAVSLFAEPILRLQAGGSILAEQVLDLNEPAAHPEVRTLFGAQQIGRLERMETSVLDADARDALLDELGYATDALRTIRAKPIYAENARAEGSVVHQLLVRESLRYGLVCRQQRS